MADLRTAAQQALECLKGVARGKYDGNAAEVCAALEAALAQQAEPNVEYERGFIDGMQKQAQSSVDRAVNRMAEQAMLGVWQDVPGAVNFGITGDNNG